MKINTPVISISLGLCLLPLSAYAEQPFAPTSVTDSFILEGFGAEPSGLDITKHLSASLKTDLEYNDNIFLSGTNEESDLIYRVGLSLEFSSNNSIQDQKLTLAYAPSYEGYLDNSSEDNIAHDLSLSLLRTFAKTKIDFNAFARKSQAPNRFVEGVVDRFAYGFDLDVVYDLTAKSSLDFDFGFERNEFEQSSLFDTETYEARLAWLYKIGGKTSIGPYLAADRVFVASNPSHLGLSLGATGTYAYSGKTIYTGSFGIEHRSFSGDGDSQVNAEFDFSVEHQLTGKTSLRSSVYNKVTASSVDDGLAYDDTGIALEINHEYSSKIKFNGAVNYVHNTFFSTRNSAFTDRDADAFILSLGIDYAMDESLSAQVGIKYMLNDSEDSTRESNNTILNLGLVRKF
jgi:hypothetical protein|tara:strand:- start:1867 stop:3072 length:1206 start_codon:yes stop_codon:yes gene_type:complete